MYAFDCCAPPTFFLGTPAGHGRWDAFLPKILHVIGTPTELASLRTASLNGGWELENDCRIGSVKHFAASQDPRAVSAVVVGVLSAGYKPHIHE